MQPAPALPVPQGRCPVGQTRSCLAKTWRLTSARGAAPESDRRIATRRKTVDCFAPAESNMEGGSRERKEAISAGAGPRPSDARQAPAIPQCFGEGPSWKDFSRANGDGRF